MKTEKFDGCLTAFRWRPVVLAMMVSGVFAGTIAGAQVSHPPYKDLGGMEASKDCRDTNKFKSVYLPDPMPSTGHVYVLLLIFNSDAEAGAAGPILFHANAPDENPKTWSCVEDPTDRDSVKGIPYGLVAKGGCPTDCALLASEFQSLYMQRSRKQKLQNDPLDPLEDMPGKPGWAIFSAGDIDATCEHPGARVWQIRAANAVHAAAILAALKEKGLTTTPGYIGHLVIGYKPAKSSASF
jgi:hypothetical protein